MSKQISENIKIEICKRRLNFRRNFKIAYEEVSEVDVIFIKIIDSAGNYGVGSASPDEQVTGEKISDLFNILKKKLTKNFFSFPISQIYKYHEKIQNVFNGFPSGQAAVEEAILNLSVNKYKISLGNFFGGYRDICETMITIGIKNNEETEKEIKERLNEGFKVIKLKCGNNLEEDMKKISMARKVIPNNCKLALDANQGYSLYEAETLLNFLKNYKISFIEQPIKASNISGLKKLSKLNITPIIADESVVTVKDAYNLLSKNYVDGVNIKLMKCGGPINFVKIFNLAKIFNKIIMIGCMYESNISITTGAHLALSLPIDYVDLDSGHLDFADDPAKGGAIVKNGKITITGKCRF